MTTLSDLGRGNYVQLTTFRRSGEGVDTPVWLASDGDALVVITVGESGKVKRVRHTPRVLLRRSNIVGRVRAGAASVEGVAEIVADHSRVEQYVGVLRRKYGWQFRLAFGNAEKLRGNSSHVILRITPV